MTVVAQVCVVKCSCSLKSRARTVDGFEMQLDVDHLGRWTLTALLLPALLRTPGSRIVTVTSTAHLEMAC